MARKFPPKFWTDQNFSTSRYNENIFKNQQAIILHNNDTENLTDL